MSERTERILVTLLVRIRELQPRTWNIDKDGLNPAHVQSLLESDPADWPPIVVAPDDQGRYVVLDGHHRVQAALRMKLPDLLARVVPIADREIAFDLNNVHGLALALEDRKEHARYLHGKHPDWSTRQIGKACGLHQSTVSRLLRKGDAVHHYNEKPSSIEGTFTQRSIDDVLRTLVHGIVKVWDSRGLTERLIDTGPERIGRKLAETLAVVHGDKASQWAKRLEAWAHTAATVLEDAKDKRR